MTDRRDDLDTVKRYHEATKHHFRRAARSLGYLDWANQPDPFRRFAGAPRLPLVVPSGHGGPTWDGLFRGLPSPAPVDAPSIARLLYDSLAISAWKQVTGPEGEVLSRWALRVNPSSGNLHPTEGYLVTGPVAGLTGEAGVLHFAVKEFALEQRGIIAPADWTRWTSGWPDGAFLVGLTSIPWREAWKYGERAFRYCQHDAGHAAGAVALAAACLGWRVRLLEMVDTATIGRVLGTDLQTEPEAEHPDCLLAVFPDGGDHGEPALDPPPQIAWAGEPNVLSPEHHPWPIIDEVTAASTWPGCTGLNGTWPGHAWPAPRGAGTAENGPERGHSARNLIRQRRSAVAMDGETGMPLDDFVRLLDRLLPGRLPFTAVPWPAQVSLVLFVHRVDGLDPGLYLLARAPDHEAGLRNLMRQDFAWTRPDGISPDLPLFRLATGDLRDAARMLSCRQDIAADGAFSLGMLARFDAALAEFGPGFYPRLFRETGMIGQMLYLEAEAAGLRGTGIGCFFDDEVHGGLGLKGTGWQSLYHFTVGGAVDDPRLQTGEAYPQKSGTPHRG
ncbi:MAG: SagB/ThcOx family dehydrogenase [Candidatus Krumholzibacteriia bacterium]